MVKSEGQSRQHKAEPKKVHWSLPVAMLIGSILILTGEGQFLLQSGSISIGNWFMLAWGLFLFATSIWLLVKTAPRGKQREVLISQMLIVFGMVMAIRSAIGYNSFLQLKYLTGWPTPTDFANNIFLFVLGVALTIFASWRLWKQAKQ